MNGHRHTLLAWALLASVVAAFAMGVWLPLRQQAVENQTRVAELKQRIEKFEEMKSRQTDLIEELAVLRREARATTSSRFIAARSPTLGAADLQRNIKSIIDQSGANQTSSQPLTGLETDDFRRLDLSVNLAGGMTDIQAILFNLEQAEPRLFISEALIQSSPVSRRRLASRGQTSGANNTTTLLNLTARLKVSAYMRPAGGDYADAASR